MKTPPTILLYCLLFNVDLCAQTTSSLKDQQQTYNTGLSIFGNGSIASFDFELALKVKKDMQLCFKAGIGQNIIEHNCQPLCLHTKQFDMATIPLHLLSLIYVSKKKKGESFIEIGIGGTLAISHGQLNYLIYPIIGYRVYPFQYLPIHYRIYTHLPYTRSKTTHYTGYYSPFGVSVGYSL